MSGQRPDGGSRGKDVVPTATSALRASDPARLGPFRLVSRLGAGGMGMVYLGRSTTGQLAAVKVLRHELADDEDFRRRFERELAAASKVSGPFSARVLAAGASDEPQLWIATEYVPGPSLSEAVISFGPLPRRTLAPLWLGLLGALQSIHAAGVVHRDLKPSNVLLAQDGPRVIDFGVSTFSDATSLTRTGVVIGTPAFMSPEQVQADRVGPASDVFALACTMAFAASGTNPFGGDSPAHVLFRVVYEQPELPELPEQIAAAVRGSLEKDPANRPTVAELIALVPAADADEASRLLAHGKWLPEVIERRTAEHAGSVYAWDVPHRPSPRTVTVQDSRIGTAPDTGRTGPPAARTGREPATGRPHTARPSGTPTADTTTTGSRTDIGSTDIGSTDIDPPFTGPPDGAPPGGGPPSAFPPQGDGSGPGPEDEPSLRTHTLLVSADTPPLPKLRRRPWYRRIRGG
ncbi:serine/threonine-protein kinase [Streptomyces sp. NPDC006012]|uniref:serine/threonine-protein kinase n=1 Tax=Streptomyces sp. NPDC006012 TaxID=3364739 RepID=UPI0036A1D3DB